MASLQHLPRELALTILEHLHPFDVANHLLVSSQLRFRFSLSATLLSDREVAERLLRRHLLNESRSLNLVGVPFRSLPMPYALAAIAIDGLQKATFSAIFSNAPEAPRFILAGFGQFQFPWGGVERLLMTAKDMGLISTFIAKSFTNESTHVIYVGNLNDEDHSPPLCDASRNGHADVITVLLRLGANVNVVEKGEMSPLHLSALNNHVECIRLLLDEGAEIDSREENQWTPLHEAADSGHFECIPLLLDRGANIESKTGKQSTPLQLAVQNGYVECARLLLDRGAEIEKTESDKWAALHFSAQDGHLECIRLLLDRGADIESKTEKESTPLHLAALNGHVECIRFLLDRGADVDNRERQVDPLALCCAEWLR
ncbi:hypothetical protein HDU96_004450 [Phlyctochytrium bullatum]|nr:hypothetical protein HDU96_004450 [Phlyctochytrium bullatum]